MLFIWLFFLSYTINVSSIINHHFKVVIASYNNSKYYKKNLDSVVGQDYDNYEIIYIDDCSTDNTFELVSRYIIERGISNKIRLFRNNKNLKAGYNRYIGAHLANSSDIILFVDGDDWLKHNRVLSYLNSVYNDSNIWLTYGQFEFLSGLKSRIFKVGQDTNFRTHPWVTWHLRTCRAALFQKIKLKDFLYHGKFFEMAADIPESIPMLEMARNGHIVCVKDVLYVYNMNEFSDVNLDFKKQKFLEKYARSLPSYSSLDNLHQIDITINDVYFANQENKQEIVDLSYIYFNCTDHKELDDDEIVLLAKSLEKTGAIYAVFGEIESEDGLINLKPYFKNENLYAIDLREFKLPIKKIKSIIFKNKIKCKKAVFNQMNEIMSNNNVILVANN